MADDDERPPWIHDEAEIQRLAADLASARAVSTLVMVSALHQLAERWEMEGAADVYLRGDSWCHAMDTCAEELRELLREHRQ